MTSCHCRTQPGEGDCDACRAIGYELLRNLIRSPWTYIYLALSGVAIYAKWRYGV